VLANATHKGSTTDDNKMSFAANDTLFNITDIGGNATVQFCGVVESASGELLSGEWYIGVLLSIAASICSNLGMNVQKVSELWFPEQEAEPLQFHNNNCVSIMERL
jgi:hypothetical protein